MPAIYVSSVSGNDSNSGAEGHPVATIQRAVDLAAPGTTIVIFPGVFSPNFNDLSRMLVRINKPGLSLRAVIPGSVVLDGLWQCHSLIEIQGSAQAISLYDLTLSRGTGCGLLSNSGGGQNILVKGCEISLIRSNVVDTIGRAGIFTDAAASLTVENSKLHDIGRLIHTDNAFDHGIYSHGRLTVRRNKFWNSLCGWHMQIASGSICEIEENEFIGPNQYRDATGNQTQPGQIMLWGACGAIALRRNLFQGGRASALAAYAFTSPLVVAEDNLISSAAGTVFGLPPGAIDMGDNVVRNSI